MIITDSEVLNIGFKVYPAESLTFLAVGVTLGTGLGAQRKITLTTQVGPVNQPSYQLELIIRWHLSIMEGKVSK